VSSNFKQNEEQDTSRAKAQRRKESSQDKSQLNIFASSLRLCAFAGDSFVISLKVQTDPPRETYVIGFPFLSPTETTSTQLAS
jgi:hypothetical protein